MASGSELPEYSSPAKRHIPRYEAPPGSKLDFRNDKLLGEHTPEDLEEAIGSDSEFNELNDRLKSASGGLEATNLSTPTRTDSTSDDTGCPLDTDEKDEVSSTVSNLSELSGLSELSREGESQTWKNASTWVQKQILIGADPRELLQNLFMDSTPIPEQVDDLTLWKVIVNMMAEPPRRQKLRHINTISDVVRLISSSKRIIVLTGAGVSVSCGIPDFRSRDGIYSRLAQDFPDLPDPQAMFDINYFAQDPRPFFKFAREIYPGQFKPSPCHRFIKMLEKQKKLLRNYSQNIDTLEQVAGIENVIECHGSFATASCTRCKYQCKADDIREDIFAQKIPICPKCKANALPSITEVNPNESYRDLVSQGIMKPDIVFFGEGLPDAFHDAMSKDKDDCDLLIVIGSSLKVRPVALIPSSIPAHVPQILINRESLPHLKFDIELLGDGDVIINHLCHLLDGSYKEVCWQENAMKEVTQLLPPQISSEDSWEQSQDTITNPEFTQEISEPNLKAQNISSESQDSLIINTTPKRITENSEICISPFHAGHMENTEGTFTLLGESPKRRLGDSSVESSPKRIRFDNESAVFSSQESVFKKSPGHVVPEESGSKENEETLQSEEWHVVPRGNLPEKESSIDSRKEDSSRVSQKSDLAEGESDSGSDSMGMKPRHASIDSAMDSGLGDSCNSNDCTDRRIETEERDRDQSKVHEVNRHCWQSKTRECLTTRLPENSYFQLAPGRYIFPGAEVYPNFEDYDRCSVSANSDSSDSESDSSSEEEEITCVDGDFSDGAESDAESQESSRVWTANSASEDKH